MLLHNFVLTNYAEHRIRVLGNLLDNFILLHSVSVQEKGLEFSCSIDSNITQHLCGDSYRLAQILHNLVSNAIKFTSKGKIVIKVSIALETDSDILLHFLVSDTGMGIPPERIELLFQKFSQVDTSTTRTHGGTGLGLAIAKQLAELMGGTIGVQSQPNKGSDFWFTAQFSKQTSAPINVTKPIFNTLPQLLLVEDNATNQEVAKAILDTFTLQTDVVANGIEAIKALTLKNYDLVLMDIQMPEMDGYEATRQIRNPLSQVKNHQVPIIAITANALKNDKQKCLDIGINDYIRKPLEISPLLKILEKWLPFKISTLTAPHTASLSPNNEANLKIFNPHTLLMRVQGNHKSAVRITEVFLQDSQLNLEELQKYILTNNAKEIEIIAHAIKGAASGVSGEELRKIAYDIEIAAKAKNFTEVTTQMYALQTAIDNLRNEIKKWSLR